MLSEAIDSRLILMDVVAQDFADAIRLSVKPLAENGFVTDAYAERIVDIFHESGPYIVITRHIALPHAPEGSGALKTALGFTKLKRPVFSGHKTNDPVKYLFPLSAAANHSHLELLSGLADLLSREAFVRQLASVATKQDFLSLLKKYEGGSSYD
ncbi:PTS sugar transporter subunit IIA [Streptococcus sp. H49]|uniref:PTS sugar transporter subunit IIA n=1 Tax=Streptococcus huangxiaojuni TaxID=3237239 RepID=UPI0034A1D169